MVIWTIFKNLNFSCVFIYRIQNIAEKVSEREAILLVKIESLEKELEKFKKKPGTSDSSRSPSRASSRNEKINEKNKLHVNNIFL